MFNKLVWAEDVSVCAEFLVRGKAEFILARVRGTYLFIVWVGVFPFLFFITGFQTMLIS